MKYNIINYSIFILILFLYYISFSSSDLSQCVSYCEQFNNTINIPQKPYPYSNNLKLYNITSKFCSTGCNYLYTEYRDNITCQNACDNIYKYKGSVGFNQLTSIALLQCYDGCQQGLNFCQSGYYCIHGKMNECLKGTYRTEKSKIIEKCIKCPAGRYGEFTKATMKEDCKKCPENTFNNQTGEISSASCLRCPSGKFSLEGSDLCQCITEDAGSDEYKDFFRDTIPFIGRG